VGTTLIPERMVQPARFTIAPSAPLSIALSPQDRDMAITPDGAQIVYRAGTDPQVQLVVRALNELDARPLAGTTDSREPFLSPDGSWVGFFTRTELRKVSITGGAAITICRVGATPRGASWGLDDTIVFAVADSRIGLLSVPAGGGEPKVLTKTKPGKGEFGHAFPFVLPGGRAVLFTILANATGAFGENAQVAVLDLKTGQQKTLVRGGSDAVYVDPGYLIYAAAGSLRAVRFDLAHLEVLSDAVPVVEQVLTAPTGEANFAISRQGTLVYVPGRAFAPQAAPRSLVWVNRQGREEPIKAPSRPYGVARLSPDGTRVALDIRDQSSDIWTWDIARQTLTALNLDPGADLSPVWTRDGHRIIWSSTRGNGNPNLYWQAADGTGAPTRLTTDPGTQFPTSVSSDGTEVVFFGPQTTSAPGAGVGSFTALNISVVTLDGSSTPVTKPLIQSTASNANAEISLDGRWVAYQSDESGQVQIYVRPFPKVDSGRWTISPSGGTRPAWARNGRELFYLDGNGLLTSVAVQTTATTIIPSTPTRILDTPYYAGSTNRGFDLRAYDVSADGQRFLMIKDVAPTGQKSPAPAASMVVVLNWLEELKARVPTK
jgi:serine/threonine-protein kinase